MVKKRNTPISRLLSSPSHPQITKWESMILRVLRLRAGARPWSERELGFYISFPLRSAVFPLFRR